MKAVFRMNPLPIIREWLDVVGTDCDTVPRSEIIRWVQQRYPTCLDPGLAADCLIAVGIGREPEQEGTVYCLASYDR